MITSEGIYSQDYPLSAEEPVDSWRYRYVKRTFDVLCSLLMIAVFAIPGLLIAMAIVLTSEGPVFYREERIGRNGRRFHILKFRSMHRHAARLNDIEVHLNDIEVRLHDIEVL
jgi:lipopolysaccharide/colanic/teichoic acid biosynthesis glycosyltransferase